MVYVWFIIAIVWIALFILLGIRTLRRGHWVMFIIGLLFPLFWIIGALIPPTEAAMLDDLER